MNWQASLDRWLTTPPDDSYENYAIKVWEMIPESVVSDYEYDLIDDRIVRFEDRLFDKFEIGYYESLEDVARVLAKFVRHMIDSGKWKQ